MQHAARGGLNCSHMAVFEDDIALLPGFRDWVAHTVLRDTADPDFLNLHTVRAWGVPDRAHAAAVRVSSRLTWDAWRKKDGTPPSQPLRGGAMALARKADGLIRAPNMLMVAYILRRSAAGKLLHSFAATTGWKRHCTIDQVGSRVLYALADTGRFKAYVVDATDDRSHTCHCGSPQPLNPAALFDKRNAVCAREYPNLHGASRSRATAAGLTPQELQRRHAVCLHDFHVPSDRVLVEPVSRQLVAVRKPPA